MNSKILVSISALLLIIMVHASALAKGSTVKITVTNLDTRTHMESTEDAVGRFGVWEGPGVTIGGVPQGKGFIIEWLKGAVAAPKADGPRYEVKFYEGCKMSESAACHSEEPSLAYVVTYIYDPTANQGYVYLPGKGEDFYDLNTHSIYRHELEGHWFLTSDEWQHFVSPLIEPENRAELNRRSQ